MKISVFTTTRQTFPHPNGNFTSIEKNIHPGGLLIEDDKMHREHTRPVVLQSNSLLAGSTERLLCEAFHSVSDHGDAPVIRSVQLQHAIRQQGRPARVAKTLRLGRGKMCASSKDVNTRERRFLFLCYPNRSRAAARMVEVFPVPGGP